MGLRRLAAFCLLVNGCGSGDGPAKGEDPFALLEQGQSARAAAIWQAKASLTPREREGLARAWFWLGEFEKARQNGLPEAELRFSLPIEVTPDPPRSLRERAAWASAWIQKGREAFAQGRRDEAAGIVTRTQAVTRELLQLPRPPIVALHAATEADLLYGDMLRANRHWADARFLYQKNVNRWKSWSPASGYSKQRVDQALAAVAECDRHFR
jgi:tetratricopeptide (TPR) repeat protein